jgi:hypothetical protein
MVLATLTKSDVIVPSDIVESIVEEVLNFIQPYLYFFLKSNTYLLFFLA